MTNQEMNDIKWPRTRARIAYEAYRDAKYPYAKSRFWGERWDYAAIDADEWPAFFAGFMYALDRCHAPQTEGR